MTVTMGDVLARLPYPEVRRLLGDALDEVLAEQYEAEQKAAEREAKLKTERQAAYAMVVKTCSERAPATLRAYLRRDREGEWALMTKHGDLFRLDAVFPGIEPPLRLVFEYTQPASAGWRLKHFQIPGIIRQQPDAAGRSVQWTFDDDHSGEIDDRPAICANLNTALAALVQMAARLETAREAVARVRAQ